jgi:hypothetical protein
VLEAKLSLLPPASSTVDTTPMKPALSSGIKAIDKNNHEEDLKVSPTPSATTLMVSLATPMLSCTSLQSWLGRVPTWASMAFEVFPWEPGGLTCACIHAGKPTQDQSSRGREKEINSDILHTDANLFVYGSIQCITAKIFGKGPTACQPRRKSRK